jgi:prepilin-type N-terminal cleavage/methylation domain-containing protein
MKRKQSGFTIIELMIVLTIAGLIMLLVFLAVPALQRNSRNYGRKVAVQSVWSAMHDYYNQNAHYPLTNSSACSAVPECVTFVNQLAHDPRTKNYTINYVDSDEAHTYPYNPDGSVPSSASDTVVIFPAHRCQRNLATHHFGGPDYPVFTTDAADNDFRRFATYIVLEKYNKAFCIDDVN